VPCCRQKQAGSPGGACAGARVVAPAAVAGGGRRKRQVCGIVLAAGTCGVIWRTKRRHLQALVTSGVPECEGVVCSSRQQLPEQHGPRQVPQAWRQAQCRQVAGRCARCGGRWWVGAAACAVISNADRRW